MSNSYYNTNKESGSTLQESKVKAKTQEDIILDIFKDKIKLSASEAWHYYSIDRFKTPLTSIRRGITNLCNENKLVKTDQYKIGVYGKKEHYYRLFTKYVQLTIF